MARGKAHEPTDELRAKVKKYAAVGTRHEDIAFDLEISINTLKKYYKKELRKGRTQATAAVAGKCYELAMAGVPSMICFWLKCRGGWRETGEFEQQVQELLKSVTVRSVVHDEPEPPK